LMAYAVAVVALATTLPMSTVSAVAADLAVPPPSTVVARPLWTGFYIGLNGGWGGGSTRIQDPTMLLAFQQVSYATSGPFVGAQMGADWQFGNFVVGGELEGSAATIKGNSTLDPNFPISGFATKFRALAMGTGRAGYAVGSFLGYGKFGVAWADLELTDGLFSIRPQVIDHSRTGIVGGAGIEMLLIGNLSAKLEYNFIWFGATSMALGTSAFVGPQNVDHTVNLVKAGLNFRFGGGDYVVARY
jgi:outer membrane immunogenic protein